MEPTPLYGNLVNLLPLRKEHTADLAEASKDGELWKLWFTGVAHPDQMEDYVEKALLQQKAGQSIPYVVQDKSSNTIIGCTRFCHIDSVNNRREIGYTWYRKSAQRTGANTECKWLLLRHAFEDCGCIAIEFRTHHLNHRSRAAIARLGAKQDGILRNHIIMPDGTMRDTVVFSILNSEWPTIDAHLTFKMSQNYEPIAL